VGAIFEKPQEKGGSLIKQGTQKPGGENGQIWLPLCSLFIVAKVISIVKIYAWKNVCITFDDMKSTLNIHWKDWCWSWSSSTLATWCKEPTHWKSYAGKDWRQKEKRAAEDEMVRQHRWLNGHESGQTQGNRVGPGSLMYCSPWGHKELNMA